MQQVILTSVLTGLFCAGFAGVIDAITDALTMWQVIGLGAVSGLCGSLVSQLVLGRHK